MLSFITLESYALSQLVSKLEAPPPSSSHLQPFSAPDLHILEIPFPQKGIAFFIPDRCSRSVVPTITAFSGL